jgi:hypothetical protein
MCHAEKTDHSVVMNSVGPEPIETIHLVEHFAVIILMSCVREAVENSLIPDLSSIVWRSRLCRRREIQNWGDHGRDGVDGGNHRDHRERDVDDGKDRRCDGRETLPWRVGGR